ncbi:SDR family oxidoreductase [Phytomonospora sp. NPDC050363]|uniref:SDR family NAD(P)-dependent oxidoreductase n=1 Tax=Phytomonospora sp. NPDC050363 TaxID=3155642 RepID=UPI0033E6605B
MEHLMARKVALITGGSRGIGAAIARRFAPTHDVVITYVGATERAEALVEELHATGARALAVRTEAADAADLRAAVDRTVAEFGHVDVVVGNAGIAPYGPLADVTLDEVDRTLAIHARASFLLAQAAAPHIPDGGRIVFIGSSLADRVPYAGWSLYAMSKSALSGLAKGLARDLGPRGITVNVVAPGSTDTEMNPSDGPDADEERSFTALGRYCSPDDIAATVAHLAGDGGRMITGAVLAVDAGVTA